MIGMKRDVFYDLDGSATNGVFDANTRTSATIINNFQHIAAETDCVSATTPAEWDSTIVCDGSLNVEQVAFKNLMKKTEFMSIPIKVKLLSTIDEVVASDDTDHTTAYSLQQDMEPKKEKKFSYSLPYISGRIYNIWFGTGIDFTHLAMDTNYLYD